MLSSFNKGDFIELRNEQCAQYNIPWTRSPLTFLKSEYWHSFKGMDVWILNIFAVIWRWITVYAVGLTLDDDDGYFCKNMQTSEM